MAGLEEHDGLGVVPARRIDQRAKKLGELIAMQERRFGNQEPPGGWEQDVGDRGRGVGGEPLLVFRSS